VSETRVFGTETTSMALTNAKELLEGINVRTNVCSFTLIVKGYSSKAYGMRMYQVFLGI